MASAYYGNKTVKEILCGCIQEGGKSQFLFVDKLLPFYKGITLPGEIYKQSSDKNSFYVLVDTS